MSRFETERQFATRVVAEVCQIANSAQSAITASADAITKVDRSPVTIADLAVQTVVSHRLAERFPHDPLLAEEDVSTLEESQSTTDRVLELAADAIPGLDSEGLMEALGRGGYAGGADRHWVLDPIDGTKGFLRGDQYAVALALVRGGQVVVGVLGCPNLSPSDLSASSSGGTVYSAEKDRGVIMLSLENDKEKPISVDNILEPSSARFCESVEAAHAAHSDQAQIAARLGISLPPARIDSQCKYAIVARGGASIYLRLPRDRAYREKVWDHAAGVLVIEEAGGRVSDLDGRPLDFSEGRYLARSHGIIATNGHLHEQVLSACREVLELD